MSRLPILLALLIGVGVLVPTASQSRPGDAISEARRLLEQERAAEALVLLEPLASGAQPSAEAVFLISNARFVLGDAAGGRAALERSIELDANLREAWITLGALDLAEGRPEAALASFLRAQQLDPSAADNGINLGATYIFMSDLANATRQFNSYLSERRGDSMAYYLVAKNYALGDYRELTVQHLEAAITLDEKTRRLARRDPAFVPLAGFEPFAALLATDSYRPAADSHGRTEVFSEPYDGGHGTLLRAVLNALQFSARPFDPNVEVTDDWALIWSDIRMKLSNAPSGGGQIEFSAPGATYTSSQWDALIDELAGQIREQVAVLSMRRH